MTIVAWGRVVWTALDAAAGLEKSGIDAEVLDLRTLVPPDLDGVAESVQRTGRLIVAAEDREFSGLFERFKVRLFKGSQGFQPKPVARKTFQVSHNAWHWKRQQS